MESLPHFHQMVYQQIDVQPDRTKTKVMQNIGQHLSKSKHPVQIICEYLYGISGTQKAVAKRERICLNQEISWISSNSSERLQKMGPKRFGIQLLWQSPHHFWALVNITPTLCERTRMIVCKKTIGQLMTLIPNTIQGSYDSHQQHLWRSQFTHNNIIF